MRSALKRALRDCLYIFWKLEVHDGVALLGDAPLASAGKSAMGMQQKHRVLTC